jgi:hypothetical protein
MSQRRAVRGAAVAAQSPIFWVTSGLIFFANALFVAVHGYWLLSILQMVTAAMAALAAAQSLEARRPR